ncbi:MAG: 2OG-Fe(II) oxygenase family protein [Gammaproteobacteria bacterium]
MELNAINYTDADAAERFVQSLHETGFGVLKKHPLLQEQVDSIYRNWKAFFDREEKRDFVHGHTHDGFFPIEMAEAAKDCDIRDIKEYFQFYLWGQCPDDLRQELQDYYDDTCRFASELLGWIEQYSPGAVRALYDEPLSSMLEDSEQSMLRILHYPPLKGDELPNAIRAAAHEDINLITILPAAHEPGLQVQRRDGSWMDVPCDFGNLIINIGDMLQEASGGYFPSTTHRVINPPDADHNRSRISLPLFLHPRPNVVLSSRYTADSYLKQRLAELREASN